MDEEKKKKKEKEKKRRKEERKQKLFKAKEVENSRVVNSETKVSQRFDFIVPFFFLVLICPAFSEDRYYGFFCFVILVFTIVFMC